MVLQSQPGRASWIPGAEGAARCPSGRASFGARPVPHINRREQPVERSALIKKLETLLDEAKRQGMYGTIELQLRDGDVEIIRTSKTEKVQTENNRGHQSYR
jgi:hypothetical protein